MTCLPKVYRLAPSAVTTTRCLWGLTWSGQGPDHTHTHLSQSVPAYCPAWVSLSLPASRVYCGPLSSNYSRRITLNTWRGEIGDTRRGELIWRLEHLVSRSALLHGFIQSLCLMSGWDALSVECEYWKVVTLYFHKFFIHLRCSWCCKLTCGVYRTVVKTRVSEWCNLIAKSVLLFTTVVWGVSVICFLFNCSNLAFANTVIPSYCHD